MAWARRMLADAVAKGYVTAEQAEAQLAAMPLWRFAIRETGEVLGTHKDISWREAIIWIDAERTPYSIELAVDRGSIMVHECDQDGTPLPDKISAAAFAQGAIDFANEPDPVPVATREQLEQAFAESALPLTSEETKQELKATYDEGYLAGRESAFAELAAKYAENDEDRSVFDAPLKVEPNLADIIAALEVWQENMDVRVHNEKVTQSKLQDEIAELEEQLTDLTNRLGSLA